MNYLLRFYIVEEKTLVTIHLKSITILCFHAIHGTRILKKQILQRLQNTNLKLSFVRK